jgi:hypothetical protein
MTLQHIVLFSFPEQLSAKDAAEMLAMVATWPAEIGNMSKLRFGTDLTGARTNGYSQLLYMEFAGADELKAYQQHPVHQVFLRWVKDQRCTPLAFDYFLDTETVLIPEHLNHEAEERQ